MVSGFTPVRTAATYLLTVSAATAAPCTLTAATLIHL